jgi:RnfABCDGE-type electron transport complex B subunit
MITTLTLALAVLVLAILAVAMGWVLGWANKAFEVPVDPKVSAINAVLPGANCGGCGFVGCGDYAEAVVKNGAALTLCGPGGASCAQKIGAVMGVEVSESWPYKAVVHCAADHDKRLKRIEYKGEQTCAAANLVSGIQGCTFGCLGLSDCVRVCKYDAIHVVNGLAVVDYEKCTGCKACEVACPRNIITMVPFKAERVLVVACSNKDNGPVVKEVCSVGCIGCKGCIRPSAGLFEMKDNIPQIDYTKYDPTTDFKAITDKCRMESLVFVGKPTPADIAATADEVLPDRIEANFKTTVDDTEWRG